MNYKIVHSWEELSRFLNWLPDLTIDEWFYFALFARKKYSDKIITNKETQLRRFVTKEDYLRSRIRQLEVPYGAWVVGNIAAPQKSLVLYMHTNPRSNSKAADAIHGRTWELRNQRGYNIKSEVMSAIYSARSRAEIVTFDLDEQDLIDEKKLQSIINPGTYIIIKTRGGFHLLVKPNQQTNPLWHPELLENFKVDDYGDIMSPVPGTTQGGFVPYVYSWGKPVA